MVKGIGSDFGSQIYSLFEYYLQYLKCLMFASVKEIESVNHSNSGSEYVSLRESSTA